MAQQPIPRAQPSLGPLLHSGPNPFPFFPTTPAHFSLYPASPASVPTLAQRHPPHSPHTSRSRSARVGHAPPLLAQQALTPSLRSSPTRTARTHPTDGAALPVSQRAARSRSAAPHISLTRWPHPPGSPSTSRNGCARHAEIPGGPSFWGIDAEIPGLDL